MLQIGNHFCFHESRDFIEQSAWTEPDSSQEIQRIRDGGSSAISAYLRFIFGIPRTPLVFATRASHCA
jgi:hypothetical protein